MLRFYPLTQPTVTNEPPEPDNCEKIELADNQHCTQERSIAWQIQTWTDWTNDSTSHEKEEKEEEEGKLRHTVLGSKNGWRSFISIGSKTILPKRESLTDGTNKITLSKAHGKNRNHGSMQALAHLFPTAILDRCACPPHPHTTINEMNDEKLIARLPAASWHDGRSVHRIAHRTTPSNQCISFHGHMQGRPRLETIKAPKNSGCVNADQDRVLRMRSHHTEWRLE